MITRKLSYAVLAAAATLVGALASGQAQARGPVDVQWQVTIGSHGGGPVYMPAPVYQQAPVYVPAPVYQQAPVYMPAPVYRPAPVYQHAPVYMPAPMMVVQRPGRDYCPPTRWDVDGDGIPNRHDRVYNPRWDRDGDGYRDRDERHGHHDRGQRDSRENRDDRRDDRHDNRRDWRGR